MAKAQYPIDGMLGKDWKVTSYMGMRIHPVTKVKKHHNGTDIWSPHSTCYIEAPVDSKVVYAGPSKLKKKDGEPDGFGYYVILIHMIDGLWYTSLYAHMEKGSLKVKTGQKIEAGTVLGKMGTTGMSTGKHLHWELRLGKQHIWDANGKNYIEPVAFFKAYLAKQKAIASAHMVAKDTDPVAPAPKHNANGAKVLEGIAKPTTTKPVVKTTIKPAAKPAVKPVIAKKPELVGELKRGSKGAAVSYLQKSLKVVGDTAGVFGDNTAKAVYHFQKANKLKADGIVGPLTWGKLK